MRLARPQLQAAPPAVAVVVVVAMVTPRVAQRLSMAAVVTAVAVAPTTLGPTLAPSRTGKIGGVPTQSPTNSSDAGKLSLSEDESVGATSITAIISLSLFMLCVCCCLFACCFSKRLSRFTGFFRQKKEPELTPYEAWMKIKESKSTKERGSNATNLRNTLVMPDGTVVSRESEQFKVAVKQMDGMAMSDLYSGEHQNSVTLNPMLAALGSDSKTTHSASTASAPDGPLNEPTLSPDGTVRNPMTQDLDYDYDHVLAAPPALPLAATESNAEGMLVAALIGHTDGVTCLASSKDNKHLLLSGTLSGEVRQWNVAKKESIKTIPAAHKKRVNGITLGFRWSLILLRWRRPHDPAVGPARGRGGERGADRE